jgi:hypothetical protein
MGNRERRRRGISNTCSPGQRSTGVAGFRWGRPAVVHWRRPVSKHGRRSGASQSTSGAAEAQLDLAKLLVAAVSPAGLHGRRMEDGRWRCFSVPANCVARRRRKAWRARARRSFGRHTASTSYRVGRGGQPWRTRMPRGRRRPAPPVSAKDTGGIGALGLDGLRGRAGAGPRRWVDRVRRVAIWAKLGCGL